MACSVAFVFYQKRITLTKEKLQILNQLETQLGELQNTDVNTFNIFHTTNGKKTKVVRHSHIPRTTTRTCDLVKVTKQDRDDKIQEAGLCYTISYVRVTENGNVVKRHI